MANPNFVVIDPNGGGLFQLRLSQNDMYDIPNRRMIDHRVPGAGYLRIGALRAPLDCGRCARIASVACASTDPPRTATP